MSRGIGLHLGSLVLLSLVSFGCAKKQAAMPGAVYANAVAVYRGAEFDGAMGGETSADFGGPAVSESMSWFFKTDAPMSEIVAFYEKELPGARKEMGEDENEVVFTVVPEGAEPEEELKVIVSDGRTQIHESTKPGKHKDEDCYDKTMDGMGLGFLK